MVQAWRKAVDLRWWSRRIAVDQGKRRAHGVVKRSVGVGRSCVRLAMSFSGLLVVKRKCGSVGGKRREDVEMEDQAGGGGAGAAQAEKRTSQLSSRMGRARATGSSDQKEDLTGMRTLELLLRECDRVGEEGARGGQPRGSGGGVEAGAGFENSGAKGAAREQQA